MSMMLRRAMMMASSLVQHIISSVSGLVTFTTNVAADMPSVLCEVAPVQTGYNTPSPSNVRPISGWTGLLAFRGGNNAFDANAYGSITGYIDANGKIATTSSNSKTVWFEVKPNTSYTISLKAIAHVVSSVIGSDDVQIGLYSSTPALNVIGTRIYAYNRPDVFTDYYHTVQFNSGANTYVAIKIGVPAKTDINASIATLVAVETATISSVTASWQSSAGTVYGGTLDLATGVLTKTMENIASYNGESIGEPWVSSKDVYTPGGTPTTGAQVVYTLPTPQTVQLTANQMASLIGTNNIWHNANGGITVEYYDNQ